jgi:hypothetical protein
VSEARLRELLTAGGVTGAAQPGPQPADSLDVIRTWAVWQQYASEQDADVHARYGPTGEYFEVALEQAGVRTVFRYATAGAGAYEASSAGTSHPEFFAEVLTTPGFQLDADPESVELSSSPRSST